MFDFCFVFNETLRMDPNLFPPKGRELVSPEWCLKGEHLHGGTRTTLAHTRTRRTRGTGTEEVRAWRHDVSAHVRGVGVGVCGSFPHAQQGRGGRRGNGGQLWRLPAFPACPGAAGLALTNLNEEPQRFRRHFRVMPDLINLAGRKG